MKGWNVSRCLEGLVELRSIFGSQSYVVVGVLFFVFFASWDYNVLTGAQCLLWIGDSRFSGDANGYVGALDAASGRSRFVGEIFQAASGILQVAQAEG